MILNFEALIPSLPFILGGVLETVRIVLLALLIGSLLGTLLSLLKISRVKPLALLATVYISVFRGTPVIVQLTILYFGLPQLVGIDLGVNFSAILALGLNSAAYISEIVRAGIASVDKGQTEAAMALGIPYRQMMQHIILPQAFKNILPALINEFTALTKESAVVTVIGATDIMRRSMMVGGQTFLYFESLIVAAVLYFILVTFISLSGKLVERRLRVSD